MHVLYQKQTLLYTSFSNNIKKDEIFLQLDEKIAETLLAHVHFEVLYTLMLPSPISHLKGTRKIFSDKMFDFKLFYCVLLVAVTSVVINAHSGIHPFKIKM